MKSETGQGTVEVTFYFDEGSSKRAACSESMPRYGAEVRGLTVTAFRLLLTRYDGFRFEIVILLKLYTRFVFYILIKSIYVYSM